MSYILDALKKADQERKLGRPPDLTREQGAIERKRRKHPLIYVMIIMLVMAGGAAGWYFGHEENATVQKSELPQAQPSAEAQTNSVAPKNDMVAANETETPALHPIQTPAQNKTAAQDVKKPSEDKKTVVQSDERNDIKSAKIKEARGIAAPKEPAQPVAKKKPDRRVYAMSELPEEIRQSLPPFSISTHIYSTDKSERLASINGHIGREGQEITAGLLLDSITPDGVILKYQGYRFSVGLR